MGLNEPPKMPICLVERVMGMRVKGWGAGLSVHKTAHEPVDLLLGTLQVVVDHDMVEAWRKGKFVGSLAHALLDGLGGR
jgi:hypothetical protein